MEPLLGQIIMFAGSFAPRGWAFCDGQELPIAQNNALFSLLGTTYGGDGRTTFALPDLRGRVAIHAGTGPGLSSRIMGQQVHEQRVVMASGQGDEVQGTVPPGLCLNYLIALEGIYPSRN